MRRGDARDRRAAAGSAGAALEARPHARTTGFTLIEVLVVVGVVALAGGIVVPRMNRVFEARVGAAARRLADQVNEARERAILSGQPVHLRLDLDAGRWSAGAGPEVGRLPDGAAIRAVVIEGAPARAGGTVTLTFDPGGERHAVRIEVVEASGRGVRSVVLPAGGRRAQVLP